MIVRLHVYRKKVRVVMTENETIKELETSIDLAKMCTQNYDRKKEIQVYEMAIKALEEVQQYRQIGTVEECREAVEKQKKGLSVDEAKRIAAKAICIGCVKGGMGYWNRIRRDFPEVFESRAQLERLVGYSILKESDGTPLYLDELDPNRGDMNTEIFPDCGIMCYLAQK